MTALSKLLRHSIYVLLISFGRSAFLTIVVFAGTLAVVCHFITHVKKYRRLRVKVTIIYAPELAQRPLELIPCKHFEQARNRPSRRRYVPVAISAIWLAAGVLTFPSVPMQSQEANIGFCCTRLKLKLGHVGLLDFLANYPVTKQLFPEKPSGVVTSPSLCSLLVL